MENLTDLWNDITKKLLWAVIVLVATSSLMAFNNSKTLKESAQTDKTQTETLGDIVLALELLKMDLEHTKDDIEKHIDNHD